MSTLMAEMNGKALGLGIPLSAHVDLTYRCNERCIHCYLPHDDRGELSTAEVKDLFGQLAEAGVFFLTISGGEPFLRTDLFELLAHARALTFNVKLKTNGILIGEKEVARLRKLGIETVQISIYSHRPEVHDKITAVKGSLERSLAAIRFLRASGLKVTIAHVIMQINRRPRHIQPGIAQQRFLRNRAQIIRERHVNLWRLLNRAGVGAKWTRECAEQRRQPGSQFAGDSETAVENVRARDDLCRARRGARNEDAGGNSGFDARNR